MSLGKNIGVGALAIGLGFSGISAVQQPTTAQARIRIHSYKQAERAVARKHGHYFHGRYYIWTVMGTYSHGHIKYLMRHHGHWVYWVRGMDYYGQKHRSAGSYWGHDYYVYLNGHVSSRY
ncbi:hypothetical protein [Secundilactobacillus folii]|uniref:Uncharacterized protein n=1 Tax=Secundilactobacillus folii TaxID=2678357 RepID=A0A7X3C3A2_9LACO|nr:hypothetical protein [Secundilactobacillus folii]MTV82677.1 hypothetical protein [Secundilactobacillus folii]